MVSSSASMSNDKSPKEESVSAIGEHDRSFVVEGSISMAESSSNSTDFVELLATAGDGVRLGDVRRTAEFALGSGIGASRLGVSEAVDDAGEDVAEGRLEKGGLNPFCLAGSVWEGVKVG
jgi:hypothetical protein